MKKIKSCLVALALASTTAVSAVPSEIIFNNNTSLDLATSISGWPGNGVAPNVTRPVSYEKVTMVCHITMQFNNCPITFADRNSGEPVATVYINAETATLTQPPMFHGNYGQDYVVTGWESSPISEISISKR